MMHVTIKKREKNFIILPEVLKLKLFLYTVNTLVTQSFLYESMYMLMDNRAKRLLLMFFFHLLVLLFTSSKKMIFNLKIHRLLILKQKRRRFLIKINSDFRQLNICCSFIK